MIITIALFPGLASFPSLQAAKSWAGLGNEATQNICRKGEGRGDVGREGGREGDL